MQAPLRAAFLAALESARVAEGRGARDTAWAALERAHVLSQGHAGAHVRVHWAMLRCALRRRDLREVAGQVPRLVLAAPASWLGAAPAGNTGGSNVSMFAPMPIAPEIEALLRQR